jgi:hypothetical protein
VHAGAKIWAHGAADADPALLPLAANEHIQPYEAGLPGLGGFKAFF